MDRRHRPTADLVDGLAIPVHLPGISFRPRLQGGAIDSIGFVIDDGDGPVVQHEQVDPPANHDLIHHVGRRHGRFFAGCRGRRQGEGQFAH